MLLYDERVPEQLINITQFYCVSIRILRNNNFFFRYSEAKKEIHNYALCPHKLDFLEF